MEKQITSWTSHLICDPSQQEHYQVNEEEARAQRYWSPREMSHKATLDTSTLG